MSRFSLLLDTHVVIWMATALHRPPPVKSAKGWKAAVIDPAAVVHMSEAEVVDNIAAVLAKIRGGSEIVIEQGDLKIAIVEQLEPAGRLISKLITDLKMRGVAVTMDDNCAHDIIYRSGHF